MQAEAFLSAIRWQLAAGNNMDDNLCSLDYERLWMNFNRTNKWILQRLASNKPLQSGEYRTSTIYSALKRLQKDGYVIYSNHYEMEDPFFKEWILTNNK